MTAIRSRKTIRTEDMTAKPAFRGCRAMVAAAAVVACGLLAAPLQADHESFSATVTLTATPGDGEVTLNVGGITTSASFAWVGYQYRGGPWDTQWTLIGGEADDSGAVTASVIVQDLTNGVEVSFEARAFRANMEDGEWHFQYSGASDSVSVTPTAPTTTPAAAD